MEFDRKGSTLGIMDDLQIAVHTYDGCSRGCSGCLVDAKLKNKRRFEPLMSPTDMSLVHDRVLEYYDWVGRSLNSKEGGYFGESGMKVEHFSYTFRFGNHSELPLEALMEMSEIMNAPFKVFSTAPTEEVVKFEKLAKKGERIFLEIIYDPVIDDPMLIRDMIVEMRRHGIAGYPEVLLTRKLLSSYPNPSDFVREKVAPLGDLGTQMQFGRYSPSKTRNFNTKQMLGVDEEVEWLVGVAKEILAKDLDIHPIPIAEYAVTLLDEYGEGDFLTPDGIVDEVGLAVSEEEPFLMDQVIERTKDIFKTSLYVDMDLSLYVWSESMGQHVLDSNFGFKALGNLRESSIEELANGVMMEALARETVGHLARHAKCSGCRYKTFCASHAIPFFRKFQEDSGRHCYGYVPVIREFQKRPDFLRRMIDGFKELEF